MIQADGGKGEFENVTLGTSAYEALANGSVDFTLEVYTWEGVKAKRDDDAQRAFTYADYGVPDQHTKLLGSSAAHLKAHPDDARTFLAPPCGAMPMRQSMQTMPPTSLSPPAMAC